MVSDVYSACSVCLIPLKKGIIGNSVPSKAGLVMACRRPIVNSVDYDSHYFSMFNENQIGISVSNEDSEAVVKAILGIYRDKETRCASNGHALVSALSRTGNTRKFIRL